MVDFVEQNVSYKDNANFENSRVGRLCRAKSQKNANSEGKKV